MPQRVTIDCYSARSGDAEAVLPATEELRALADQHDLKFWRSVASTYADWAQVRLAPSRRRVQGWPRRLRRSRGQDA